MANKVQIINGHFQSPDGDPLANGTLEFRLNQDAAINGQAGQVNSKQIIVVDLDSTGNVPNADDVELWPNDQLTPSTYYIVRGKNSLGEPVWGPFYGQITGTSPFDLDTWIPGFVGGNQIAPVGSITLQTNDVNNSSQSILNLTSDDDSVTLTASAGGKVDLSASSGTPSGSNVAFIGPKVNGSGLPSGFSPDSVLVRIPASSIAAIGTAFKVTITFDSSSSGSLVLQNSVVRRTLPGGTTFTDTRNLTWGGIVTPTFNTTSTKQFVSDSCSVPLDGTHDIYIILRMNVSLSSGGVVAADFSEQYIAKFSGEVFTVAYDTVSAIPSLTTLDSSLSAQSVLVSKIAIT